jgi:phosphatidate cytidylyltransferase
MRNTEGSRRLAPSRSPAPGEDGEHGEQDERDERISDLNSLVQTVSNAVGLKPGVAGAMMIVAATLALGSLMRIVAVRGADPQTRRERLGSLTVWWAGLAILSLVAFGGPPAGVIVFGTASALGLGEYFRLSDHLRIDPTGRLLAYLAIPFTYAAVWLENDLWFAMSVPVVCFLLFAARLIGSGKTTGYLAAVGSLTFGTGLLVFLLAHAARLLTLPAASNPVGGITGWLVYLVVLTESDDIFQALWGRRFGRRKITPRISPNKSLEGLVGGVATTLILGIVLAPWLTPLAEPWVVRWGTSHYPVPYAGAVAATLLISLAGFLGDLNMSALKRDAGVKDTGQLLPGQGGLLDRIDSLTFTAPVFYYFVRTLYG